MEDNVLVDVWGGHMHQDHVARYLRPMDQAFQIARNELSAGYLVNLRTETRWGKDTEFDDRTKH